MKVQNPGREAVVFVSNKGSDAVFIPDYEMLQYRTPQCEYRRPGLKICVHDLGFDHIYAFIVNFFGIYSLFIYRFILIIFVKHRNRKIKDKQTQSVARFINFRM
jgi:hypothetical protein